MLKIGKSVFLTLGLCYGALLHAATAPEQLMATLQNITTFKANFAQNINSAEGDKLSHTQGQMVISRPGKFYWKGQKPDQILVVADGKFVWTYDADLEQVTKQELKQALMNSPATLLAGDASKLNDTFDISYAKKCPAHNTCYELKPKQKDSTFSIIIIRFSDNKLNEVRMRDPLGQNVKTVFSQVEVNQAINRKLFDFKPPKGVDVIEAGN